MKEFYNNPKTCMVFENSLAYYRQGIGKTILFIHSITTHSFIWRKIIPFFIENYDVISIDLLKIIRHNIRHTYNLVKNLLLWSQSQGDTLMFNPINQNLSLLVIQTVELLRGIASNKSIEIENKIAEYIFVYADNDMLSTIIRNLTSNAIKYTPKKGKIIITAQTTINDIKGFTEIWVIDTGVGISSEIQSKLFNITENKSILGTAGELGTGLGLILCKEFVVKHGGNIWVESKVGKGSTFFFTLPLI